MCVSPFKKLRKEDTAAARSYITSNSEALGRDDGQIKPRERRPHVPFQGDRPPTSLLGVGRGARMEWGSGRWARLRKTGRTLKNQEGSEDGGVEALMRHLKRKDHA